MDTTTQMVKEMYSRFPYPSPTSGRKDYKELANPLRLFAHETGLDYAGKRILDAGTGSGHRLLEAAALYPDTEFVGIDMSETALEVASHTARVAGIENVSFEVADLMEGFAADRCFDVVLTMGVLHHTADPSHVLRKLVATLADDGLVFTYVYGKWGAHERMRRKAILSLLLQGETTAFERGIELARDLGFTLEEYGWNVENEDQATIDALIVDSYLNVNDQLFDLTDLVGLMRESGLHSFAPYGVTVGSAGLLFDVYPEHGRRHLTQTTNFRELLGSENARAAFEALGLDARYRLADLVYQPNGYTLVGFRQAAAERLGEGSRMAANACGLRTA